MHLKSLFAVALKSLHCSLPPVTYQADRKSRTFRPRPTVDRENRYRNRQSSRKPRPSVISLNVIMRLYL